MPAMLSETLARTRAVSSMSASLPMHMPMASWIIIIDPGDISRVFPACAIVDAADAARPSTTVVTFPGRLASAL